ncbi:sensor histidine kinase [Paenibacillus sp. GCM10012307]|uniref:histidine kinase n=1 Tax=Paenibacillus roseus TaxID=2798579 RepID=A0A934IV74_9BACL|nr:HAMP domain-containing sensor histidine kinase [Paenibacillus roseus]MBJ6359927.1 HAMP domain-containing histidine kinase [Paenibacillus roseus]
MRTIRARILWSLMLVMVCTVIVTVGFYSHITYRMLIDQTESQLLLQLDKAIDILEGGSLMDLEPDDLRLRFKHHEFNARFYIVDSQGLVVAASNERFVGKPPALQQTEKHGTSLLEGNKVMYVSEKMDGYTVVLFTPEKLLNRMFAESIRLVAASIAVSSLILYVIGFLLVWKITSPIKKLKEAVNLYDPDRGVLKVSQAGAAEIDELVDTLQSMSGRIRNHHANQIDFLQTVSHELRTPLMSIQGYANAIKDQVVTQEKGLAIITEESYRLIRMVDRLMQLTRLENPDLLQEEQWIDLKEMVLQASDLLSTNAMKHGVQITWTAQETRIMAPPEQLFELLINLLQNAIRYAAAEVHVSFGSTDEQWFLAVEDDGDGVPAELQERIFDRYFKGESGQTGLGLSICRRIAESMQAKLAYEKSELGGARFVVMKQF